MLNFVFLFTPGENLSFQVRVYFYHYMHILSFSSLSAGLKVK